jgi:predicted DNA-binding transcriptional regulator AlpA
MASTTSQEGGRFMATIAEASVQERRAAAKAARTTTATKSVPAYAYPPALIGAEEVAHYIGVSKSKVWMLAYSEQMPTPIKLGGRSVWRKSDLDAWIAELEPERYRPER